MSKAIVTGAAGLVGSETVRFLHNKGMEVIGIDNNMRECLFGREGSTIHKGRELERTLTRYRHLDLDIRDAGAMMNLFREEGGIALVVHCAAQPSHDWAAQDPMTDFDINARGTMILLEATRRLAPGAVFIFTSTNKVYGDLPNFLPYMETRTRYELAPMHLYATHGIDETMSIDNSTHSVFGVSKVAADVMTQEYGRYFGMKTGVFRGGCLTGSAHAGVELHGFLSYLIKCVMTGRKYIVYGYKGKQVRDNIHAADLAAAFWQFYLNPHSGQAYNIGGSRHSNCSVLEAIEIAEKLCHKSLEYSIVPDARIGDHRWWISDIRKFRRDYPEWEYGYSLHGIMEEIVACG